MEYMKIHSPAKNVRVHSPELDATVRSTMESIAAIVGSTLGPGGRPVLIERQDWGMPNLVTKDGVTVFRSLGFNNPTQHAIMESARDAAVRTVTEAGDGTTTATVLAAALVKYAQMYHDANPRVSPQRIVRRLQDAFDKLVEPTITKKLSKKVKYGTRSGRKMCAAVATVSANGDEKLAEAVMDAYDLVGDQGTVTITEASGPAAYRVERIEGYPVPVGYEDSMQKFMNAFVNDTALNRVYLKNPYYVLFNGVVSDMQTLLGLLEKLQVAWLNRPGADQHNPDRIWLESPNVVLVANGFTEQVLGSLAMNMSNAVSINVVPLLTPRSPVLNGEVHFLDDLAAMTGATVLNPLTRPMDTVNEDTLEELGRTYVKGPDGERAGGGEFEMFRFRSTIIGRNDDDELMDRADQLEDMAKNAISELDARLIRERLAALTGGIAKLTVVGSSAGDIRERKDRADDAVRAVQGALKMGVLPGGGATLIKLQKLILEKYGSTSPEFEVLGCALADPVHKLLDNTGMNQDEVAEVVKKLWGNSDYTYDAAKHDWVEPYRDGLLDSTPAVLEAIRNALSIAALLGSLGGVVVFERDREFERREAAANNDFVRNADWNPANERA